MGSYKHLYNNKSLSDITLIFSDDKFHAHKAVLVANSDLFREKLEASGAKIGRLEWSNIDPKTAEHLLKSLYGYQIDIFDRQYGASAMRASGIPAPEEGWANDWEANLNWVGIAKRSLISGAVEFHPRFRKATTETLELYLLGKQFRAAKVCDSQVRQVNKVLDQFLACWCLNDPDEGHFDETVNANEFAAVFGPLYQCFTDHEDKMRRSIAVWFEQWEMVLDSIMTLYAAIPELHLDVLRERQQRQQKQCGTLQTTPVETKVSDGGKEVSGSRPSWLHGMISRFRNRADVGPGTWDPPIITNCDWVEEAEDTEEEKCCNQVEEEANDQPSDIELLKGEPENVVHRDTARDLQY